MLRLPSRLDFVGEPDQIGERTGAHLSHHLPAMQPHRHLADADIGCDLLIDATRDQQRHDLFLAGGQRFLTRSKIGDLPFVLQPRAIAAEGGL